MKKIFALLLCCLLLTGCAAASSDETRKAEAAPEQTVAPVPSASPETAEPESVKLTVYAPDDMAEGFVTTEAAVTAVTEEEILNQLALAGVVPGDVAVNTLETAVRSDAPDTVHLNVDFNAAFRDFLFTQGTAGEYVTIGSVVNTFLTAYGADSMTITVEGEALETGHSVYDAPLSLFE